MLFIDVLTFHFTSDLPTSVHDTQFPQHRVWCQSPAFVQPINTLFLPSTRCWDSAVYGARLMSHGGHFSSLPSPICSSLHERFLSYMFVFLLPWSLTALSHLAILLLLAQHIPRFSSQPFSQPFPPSLILTHFSPLWVVTPTPLLCTPCGICLRETFPPGLDYKKLLLENKWGNTGIQYKFDN